MDGKIEGHIEYMDSYVVNFINLLLFRNIVCFKIIAIKCYHRLIEL